MAIARNITNINFPPGYNVELDDLAGITILLGQDYDLSVEPSEAVSTSVDLTTAITADEIILLDASGIPMTKAESLGAVSQTDNDRFVAITATDTTPDYLNNKLAAGTGIQLAVLNPGVDEQIQITRSAINLDGLSDVTAPTPADNNLLAYDNGTSQWTNQTAAQAGVATTTELSTHTGDGTLHFTEASISHTNILNIGTNTHAQLDTFKSDVTTKHLEVMSSGLVSGGALTSGGTNVINIASGVGYSNTGSAFTRITWSATSVSTLADGTNYIGINSSGVAVVGLVPCLTSSVCLGQVYAAGGNTMVLEIFNTPKHASDFDGKVNKYIQLVGVHTSGTTVHEKASPNFLELDIDAGMIYAHLSEFPVSATSTFTKLLNSSNYGWVPDTTNLNKVNTAYWNDITQVAASALVPMTAGYWKKDVIVRTPSGNVYCIYAQEEHQTYQQASIAGVPIIPPEIKDTSAYIAYVISQQGATTVGEHIWDISPTSDRVFGYGLEIHSGGNVHSNGYAAADHEHHIGGFTNSSTGLMKGGLVTINTNTAKFNLAAGTALFVNNTTDPLFPTHELVSWNAQSAITVTNLTTQPGTYVGVDTTGALVQSSTPFVYEQSRTIVPICFLFHASGTFIKSVLSLSPTAFDPASRINDLITSIGIVNIQGNQFTANGANVNLNKSSGKSHALGVNFHIDKKIPDVSSDVSQNAPSFQLSRRTGFGGWIATSTTNVDTNNYDNGTGGIQEITDIDFTSHTIIGGDYWTLNAATSSLLTYYVWYTVDAIGTDPAPSGKTGILVAILSTDTPSQVASKTQVVIDGQANFIASVLTNVVTVTNAVGGDTANAADVNAGVTITVTQQGVNVAPIPAGNWVAIPIYFIPGIGSTDGSRVQYPQQTFATKDLAKANIPDPTFITNPNLAANATLRTYLIVQQGTTDLSNTTFAEFIQQGKFSGGTSSTGGGGGGGGGAPVDASYIVTVADPTLTNEKVIGTDFFVTNAHVGPTAGILESKLALNYATHSPVNDPTATQKQALVGTSGTPSTSNRYVTDADPRNTDARTPTSHLIISNTAIGSEHTISGGVSGYVFKATGATTAQLMQLSHTELSNIGTNTHAQLDTFVASKGAANGLATLDASTKVPSTQISEVLAVTDLTNYASTSGTGSTAILSTITSPVTNQALAWNGTNWINQNVYALADTGANGIVVRTSLNTTTSRTLVQPAAGLIITNANGVAGNPTVTLANDLAALEGLNANGFAVRTAADTWGQRTIIGTANQIAVVNGDGVSGNPTISFANGYGQGGAQIRTWSGNVASQSGTTLITPGVTAPLITAGTQLWTLTATPSSLSSDFIIQGSMSVSASTNNNAHTAAVFRTIGGVSTYIGGSIQTFASGGNSNSIAFVITDTPNTASPVTYSLRYGTNAGTWYVNRRVAENTYGGVRSGWSIQEI